jgi:uncharacterized protein YxeA
MKKTLALLISCTMILGSSVFCMHHHKRRMQKQRVLISITAA